ncbi:patatin-like phospholipase family protein [Bradyrhizobium sp.]|uniref:patatin-like phospholipase family protein n=1 Tax=Bradyrhizobium sp. TaxID=376 RepID=UPI003C43D47C
MRDDAPPASEQDVIDRERIAIGLHRAERLGGADPAPWAGIGLSGGGIRSATFCLGVLQALAEKDLLKRFDYISSVSGGGYLATSLQWWWQSRRDDEQGQAGPVFGLSPSNFPYGSARPSPDTALTPTQLRAEKNLAFLRAHSSYLTPGRGLSIWSILGVLLRTIIISSLTWIPVIAACFLVLSIVGYPLDLLFGSFKVLSPLFGVIAERWDHTCDDVLHCHLEYPAVYALGLWTFYIVTGLFVVAALLFALVSRAPQDAGDPAQTVVTFSVLGFGCLVGLLWVLFGYESRDTTVILVAVALAVTLAVCAVIVISELMTPKSLNASYWLRRTTERIMGLAFIPSLAMLVYATIPIMPFLGDQYVSDHGVQAAMVALSSLLSGVGAALYGYYTFLRNIVPSLIGQIAATVAAIVALYMTAVTAYVLAMLLLHFQDLGQWKVYTLVGIGSAMLLAFAIALVANVNYVGFHRFYRDRLMEAFMPKDSAVEAMQSDFSPAADSLSVGALRDFFAARQAGDAWRARPYPLINTNAILINDDDRKVASRGGDNFLISPFFVGSTATGWQDTLKYIELNGPLTLASATAASGAAANASAGYIGTGITMNPLVSAVMSLLNMRLGLWVGNPGLRTSRWIRSIPTFLMMGIYAGFSKHRRDSKYLELTDGGHFENLGLYELARRKLEIILIVDGEEDPSISLSSLVSASRRIEQDFGARLDFAKGEEGPERLVMYPSNGGYPAGVKYAKAPFLVGTISYKDGSHGVLIYVKATLIRQMDFTTAGYLANNPTFPHQTTADQFFVPDQFDAYRLLGYDSAIQMIDALELQTTIASWKAVTTGYARHSDKERLDVATAETGLRLRMPSAQRIPRKRRLRRGP